ncbi:MAG: right-handed parallel beta-helix repeat-containing protein [Treponema sp.]|jgi:hypothetical protein|nr:right-handed parallel beta-helix repeat-containing protein [Treponema sp.]
MEYHVRINGNDENDGMEGKSFKTISKAAALAGPGDTVTVHEGLYREWVNPVNGGIEKQRICYQAAPGEKVVISGAEVIQDWENMGNAVWRTVIPNSLFGVYNPYKEKIYGDWLFIHNEIFHTGEVYLDGKSMYEAFTLEEVKNPVSVETSNDRDFSIYRWCCKADEKETVIWANFHGADPRNGNVEINVRPFVFWPEQNHRNYITVKGFVLKQAATQWAPPTALQTGLIGPHWAKGWIIEDNIISDSKCSGISLGKEIQTGQNEWSNLKFKQGTQREREVIFRAARADWNKETIGSHIVRNNIIFDCEQAGIVGHLGGVFSLIENNHIYKIHEKRQWGGAEIAGIKLHAAIDTTIRNNFIHNAFRGLWLDWQAQGTHIQGNVFWDNTSEDFFVEVSHGPYLADNNIFLSEFSYKELSQGGALVHNLFAGKLATKSEMGRFTPYHFPHETEIAGVMTISGGDVRFYNNLFIGDKDSEKPPEMRIFWDGALVTEGMPMMFAYLQTAVGTGGYDDYPSDTDIKPWEIPPSGPIDFGPTDSLKLPVFIKHNVYLNGAKPCKKESDPSVRKVQGIEFSIDEKNYTVTVKINDPSVLASPSSEIITTGILGTNFHAEMKYEEADGTPYTLDKDILGKQREARPVPGPFEAAGNSPLVFILAYRKK